MARTALGWPAAWPLLAFLGFAALALIVYHQALQGPFVSDDIGYITANPYTASLSAENVEAILDPRGSAKLYTANYAPVHLLLHAVERHIFADAVLGYHLVNVLVHALNATLLVALLLASRIPGLWALFGGAIFAVHPANVEAVAWISQLKTNGALALALGALLAQRRRPALALALFGLALLTKASAAFALPMAAALSWARRGAAGGTARDWAWLAAWLAILALYAIPQLVAIRHLGGVEVAAFADPWVQLRTVASIGARYLAMAVSSYGVSAFQEPEPALSWLDPWWLAALPAVALLGWRTLVGLRRRSEEAAWWIGAAAAFAPISQLFPFLNPVADRYLYFLLPGLIGGALLALADAGGRLAVALPSRGIPPALPARVAWVTATALVIFFAVHGSARARLWQSETLLLLDAARHYPEGATAHFLRARRAAQAGDVDAAVAALRLAAERGLDTFLAIRNDPGLAPIRQESAFRRLVHELAGRWLEIARARGYATQPELRAVAHAHLVREEYAEAEAALEAALRAGGLQQSLVRSELDALRARLAEGAARGRRGEGDGDRGREP